MEPNSGHPLSVEDGQLSRLKSAHHEVDVDAEYVVYSWGKAALGILGQADLETLPADTEGEPFQANPMIADALKGKKIISVAAGFAHCVARTADGDVYSWGGSSHGALGLGPHEVHHVYYHALKKGDSLPASPASPHMSLHCCDLEPYVDTPTLVSTLKGKNVVSVACGSSHTLALTDQGEVYSWGCALGGKLGYFCDDDASFINNNNNQNSGLHMGVDTCGDPFQPIPMRIDALVGKRIVAVAAGDAHSLALEENGQVYSWGSAAEGKLGLDDVMQLEVDGDEMPYQSTPTQIERLKGKVVVSIASGDTHSIALTSEGDVYSWGCATHGRLGHSLPVVDRMPRDEDGDPYQPVPLMIEGLKDKNITKLFCGNLHSMALTQQGEVYSWGCAKYGRLALDMADMPIDEEHFNYQPVPGLIQGLRGKKVVGIACGVAHNLMFTDKNEVYSWGCSLYGKLGNLEAKLIIDETNNNPFQPQPEIIKELIDIGEVSSIACGHHSSFLIAKIGTNVSHDLAKLLNNHLFSDVSFVVEGEELHLHKCILASRSEYFYNCFSNQLLEEYAKKKIEIKDCKYRAFAEMIKWIYADTISHNLSMSDLVELLGVSDRFRVVKLKYLCVEELKKHIQVDTVLEIVKASDCYQAPQLSNICLAFIANHYELVRTFTNCFDELLHNARYTHIVKKLLCGMNTMGSSGPKPKKQKF